MDRNGDGKIEIKLIVANIFELQVGVCLYMISLTCAINSTGLVLLSQPPWIRDEQAKVQSG